MKRVLQILFLGLLTATLAFAGIVLSRGVERETASAETRGETTGGVFGTYLKMALLAMKAPEEKIVMPVKGARRNQIADTWGAARGEGRTHSGQDIFAKRGTPVLSATEGYVLKVGENTLGGKVVFILGAGGRRYYYAHLDDYAPGLQAGDYVTTESVIGYVGTSGNAKGTPPHLHFGVYGAGGAINPLPLLTDRNNESRNNK